MSTTTVPGATPSMTPPSPRMTACTSGESVTIVMTTSAPAAASAGDVAASPPSATKASTFDAVRFHARTLCPAFSRFRLMGAPISPSPMNPTFMLSFS